MNGGLVLKFGEVTVEEKLFYEGKIIKLFLQKVKLINGKYSNREIIRHPGGVAILAFKDKDTVLMVEQYRKAIEKTILELPAGKLEAGENPENCGKRELEEETGFRAESFVLLGKIVTTPGFCDEYIHLYKAENLVPGQIGGDEDEFIKVHEVKIKDIKSMIKEGTIIDSKTISAFMYL